MSSLNLLSASCIPDLGLKKPETQKHQWVQTKKPPSPNPLCTHPQSPLSIQRTKKGSSLARKKLLDKNKTYIKWIPQREWCYSSTTAFTSHSWAEDLNLNNKCSPLWLSLCTFTKMASEKTEQVVIIRPPLQYQWGLYGDYGLLLLSAVTRRSSPLLGQCHWRPSGVRTFATIPPTPAVV